MKRSIHHRTMLVAAATAICLVACSGTNEEYSFPTTTSLAHDETVDVHWPNGTPDLDDPWVAALVEFYAGLALALNSADFSRAQFISTTTPEYALSLSADYFRQSPIAGRRGILSESPGPQPFTVTKISDSDHSATIELCLVQFWSHGKDTTPTPIEYLLSESSGWRVRFELVRDSPSDPARVAGHAEVSGSCDMEDLRGGVFIPAPEIDWTLTQDDMIGPDGRPMSEYVTDTYPDPEGWQAKE